MLSTNPSWKRPRSCSRSPNSLGYSEGKGLVPPLQDLWMMVRLEANQRKCEEIFAVRSIRHCGTKNLPHLLEQARPDIFKLVTEWKSVAHAGRLSFVSVLASHPTLQYPILFTSRASEGHYIVDIRGKDACLKILQTRVHDYNASHTNNFATYQCPDILWLSYERLAERRLGIFNVLGGEVRSRVVARPVDFYLRYS